MASGKQLAALAVLALLLLQASTTPARGVEQVLGLMKLTDFGSSGPAECDGQYHDGGQMLAALPTGWYAGGARCFRNIRVTVDQQNGSGRTAVATVVDECDVRDGCTDNAVATSGAVWAALGLDTSAGQAEIVWSDA